MLSLGREGYFLHQHSTALGEGAHVGIELPMLAFCVAFGMKQMDAAQRSLALQVTAGLLDRARLSCSQRQLCAERMK
jgi:hypothetical protein